MPFAISELEHNGADVVKLSVSGAITGSADCLLKEMDQALKASKLVIDWSELESIDEQAGMAFVMLWQQRGHGGRGTKNYGLSQELKKAHFATFMFMEAREYAPSEQEALDDVAPATKV